MDVRVHYKGSIVVMDSEHSIRRVYYPDYKARRAVKRNADAALMERTSRVAEFRTFLREDWLLPCIEIPGAEADDVVALMWIFGLARAVMGVDKDFLQVPGLVLHNSAREPMVHKKPLFPRYVKRPRTSWGHVLCQAIFGDKSDSIPRLMPSNGYDSARLWRQIRRSPQPMVYAWRLFGEDFIRNVHLVLVPSILMHHDKPKEFGTLLGHLHGGLYWQPSYWNEYKSTIYTLARL